MSATEDELTPAVRKVLAGIEDEELAGRYPNHAHFIDATDPGHGEMTTKALLAGEPVVLVYPDGREMLMTPEEATAGFASLLFLLAFRWLRLRSRKPADPVVQLLPRTRIEARDSRGLPTAA
jgi:hypothetical protein